MTKFHAELPNFMQNLLIYWQLSGVVPKLGVLKITAYNSDARSVLVVAGGCEDIQ